jgi:hypothetical protein
VSKSFESVCGSGSQAVSGCFAPTVRLPFPGLASRRLESRAAPHPRHPRLLTGRTRDRPDERVPTKQGQRAYGSRYGTNVLAVASRQSWGVGRARPCPGRTNIPALRRTAHHRVNFLGPCPSGWLASGSRPGPTGAMPAGPGRPAQQPCPVATSSLPSQPSGPTAPGGGHGPQPTHQPIANVIPCDSQRVPSAVRAATPACGRPVRPGPVRPPAPGLADPQTRSSHSGLAALVLFVVIRAAVSGPGPPARPGPARSAPSLAAVDPPSCRSRSSLCCLVVLASWIASGGELRAQRSGAAYMADPQPHTMTLSCHSVAHVARGPYGPERSGPGPRCAGANLVRRRSMPTTPTRGLR